MLPWGVRRPRSAIGLGLAALLLVALSLVSRDRYASTAPPSLPSSEGWLPPGVASYTRHGIPIYRLTDQEAVPSSPEPPLAPSSASLSNIVVAHPRLFGEKQKWDRLPELVSSDLYLRSWNRTILRKAAEFAALPPVDYSVDGSLTGSGVLDLARTVQLRTKHWAYAYRVTGSRHWKDRVWEELLVTSGNSSHFFGESGDNWNSQYVISHPSLAEC